MDIKEVALVYKLAEIPADVFTPLQQSEYDAVSSAILDAAKRKESYIMFVLSMPVQKRLTEEGYKLRACKGNHGSISTIYSHISGWGT